MNKELNLYIEHIVADYKGWQGLCTERTEYGKQIIPDAVQRKVRERMFDEFKNSIRIDEGSKYYKIVCNNSVHSFIVKKDSGKFKRGDILKAAGWAAPATNFHRGNILEGDLSRVRWTGAL